MRSAPCYPVDRYMVESSNKVEMVNIIDDEIWNAEPTLRPEDEVILRKLHDMLQSTADDLKLLSSDLATFRQPGVLLKSQPTPLDEEFNEKVHIEDLVTAKFHGYKIVDKANPSTKIIPPQRPINTGVQVDVIKKPTKNLAVTRTRVIEIEDKIEKNTKQKNNNTLVVNPVPAPTIAYNEFVYKNDKPEVAQPLQTKFKIQDMPRINIRSELKQQKVLQLDIFPDSKASSESTVDKSNVAVVAIEHATAEPRPDPNITLVKNQTTTLPSTHFTTVEKVQVPYYTKKLPVRKVSKMSTCESSESTNNISSDTLHNIKTQKQLKSVIKSSPKTSARDKTKSKKVNIYNKEPDKRAHLDIEEWKRKLNIVYGQTSTSRGTKSSRHVKKSSPKKSNLVDNSKKPKILLNNAEYIPYSQLTLGGVRVSDIENEISDIRGKGDIPLSPILDKIISSRENSFHKDSPRKGKKNDSPRVFTTSDENLLQEVIDIERKVNKTIEKNIKIKKDKPIEKIPTSSSDSKEGDAKDSYADDFEDEKSDNTNSGLKKTSDHTQSEHESNKSSNNSTRDSSKDGDKNLDNPDEPETSVHNRTYVKKPTLSLKNSVDVIEIVHSIDKQDTATQSNVTHKISLKETQTSPRNDRPNIQSNIQPIHNDLWPLDPKGEVEKMFKLEKDFIKKLIIDEYGELLEKSINKPSTSRASPEERLRNTVAAQKLTQTSPAHVKSVMTSPTKTKTRTTSPFLSVKVDHQTSPMVVVTNEEHLAVELEDDEEGISINLSSPRFSLRLPQTSREVLSNLEGASISPSSHKAIDNKDNVLKSKALKTHRKSTVSSSSSDVELSSEMSSLGEVKLKLKRRLRKKISSISESSESSSSKCSSGMLTTSILPLRSEGEVSYGQLLKKVTNKPRRGSKSEGETSARKPK